MPICENGESRTWCSPDATNQRMRRIDVARTRCFAAIAVLLLADCAAELSELTSRARNHEASILVIEKLFGWISNLARLSQSGEIAFD